ncbi:MAG: carboxypeptidase-like regulatory domain-containing protein [Cyclobacteriaceae bacterium]|nr:carboxypeptidase-like regulatory domain-containing protein [Cyclobacteriaceae bacterium]
MIRKLLVLGLLLSCLGVSAQSVVRGRVVDATDNSPLSFANIFIDRTTVGTAADGEGLFELKGAPTGEVELLFSFVGYKLGKVDVTVKEGVNEIGTIALTPAEQQLSEVQVKASRDKTWEKQFKKFERIFLGDDEIASECKIINPWVLDFSTKEKGKQLTAKADVPLEIENNALGYRIEFFLGDFWKSAQGYLIEGKVRFEQLGQPDEATTKKWMANRQQAYLGSTQHLFKAIIDHRIAGEKFHLYTERPGLENATSRSLMFEESFAQVLMHYDTISIVSKNSLPDLYDINMPGRVEIHNYNERSLPRVYRDMGYKVSWIQLEGGKVTVTREGLPIDPTKVITSGDMSDQRVSYMLPLNYEKGKIELRKDEIISIDRFKEKIYLHTDKPYYYQGEPLWFAAHINYAEPILKDSLSRVLYVDLINAEKKIIQSKMLNIDEGTAHGDFILSDSLPSGAYYLRSYTNWSRNYQDGIFVRPFALLNITDKVNSSVGDRSELLSDEVIIATDKDVYHTREKVNLSLSTLTLAGDPIEALLSVTVTDAAQVVPVAQAENIKQRLEVIPTGEVIIDNLLPVEYGVTVKGRLTNDRGKPVSALLDVIQVKPKNFFLTETDSLGMFTISGIQAFDSTQLMVKVSGKEKGSGKLGKLELLDSGLPLGQEITGSVLLPIESTESHQRIISEYEVPKGVMVLEEVEIKDTRIDEDAVQRYAESYGQADYVLDARHLNTSYGNLLYTLNGQLPGFVARETNQIDASGRPVWAIYTERARNSSMGTPPPPLILINNVAAVGEAHTVLSSIDPATIVRIELTTRINPMHGAQGAGGVLSIYTKTGAEIESRPQDPNFVTLNIKGFDISRDFSSPRYDLPSEDTSRGDYRATIYWNPTVVSGTSHETSLSFFAADLETSYRIEVEGLTKNGRPVRTVRYITIRND